MKKTFIRATFAVITAVYVLTHFLPHAHAATAPGVAAVEIVSSSR